MASNPTVIVGHLDDQELKQSISNLVAHVKRGLHTMETDTTNTVQAMQKSLQSLGNLKLDSNSSGDGGSTRRARRQQAETQAVKETEASYDQLLGALKAAQREVSIFKSQKVFTVQDIDNYKDAIARVVELNEKLARSQANVAMSRAMAAEKNSTFDAKAGLRDIFAVDARLKQLNQYYAQQEKLSQREAQNNEKLEKQRLAAIEKEQQARQKLIDSAKRAEDAFQTKTLKDAWRGALTMPTNTLDEIRAKIERITTLTSTLRKEGIIDEAQVNRGNALVHKLNEQLDKQLTLEREIKAEQARMNGGMGRIPSEMRMLGDEKKARESYYAFVQGYREQANQLSQLIRDEESRLLQAQQTRVTALGQNIDQNKAKIQELRDTMKQLVEEEKTASTRYGVKDGYRMAIQQTNDEINKLIAKNKELEQEQQRVSATDPLKQQNATLDELRAKRERVLNIMKEETVAQNSSTQAFQQQANAAREYSAQVKKIADEIRSTVAWQKVDKGGFRRAFALIEGKPYNITENAKMGITLEEQIERILKNINEERQRGVSLSQQQAQVSQQISDADRKAAEALGLIATKKAYTSPTTSINQVSEVRGALQSITRMQEVWVGSVNKTTVSYSTLSDYVKRLKNELLYLPKGSHEEAVKVLINEIQLAEREMRKFQMTMSRPTSFKNVMDLPTKTLDDIAYKMRQLASYRSGLNVSTQRNEISQVSLEYDKLRKRMDEILGKNQSMIGSNNALARSWNYMKNRLAFYFTVGASTAFIRNLIEVRSQYEMNERALGILIDSAERGSQIFNELSQMALISPYTLIELSNAARQLTAYGTAAKDVVNVTRRVADMAAAVGTPIERLTNALGHVQTYGYLTSLQARQFISAGIPIVKELANMYTEMEGRMVSVADVYDRMKKKAVSYNDVMQVVTSMTDEGGRFFDFQAKMADTLKVRLANLTLAWNNMLNDIGGSQQGVLVGGINALRELFLHWRDISHILSEVILAFGAYRTTQLIITQLIGTSAKALNSQILAEKRSMATTLQKEALTRKLTEDELKLIATQKQLTASDYMNALSGKNLTKSKAMLLAAINRKNVELHKALIQMGLLTAAEVRNMSVTKALALSFRLLWTSVKSTFASMATIIRANWWLALFGVAYEIVSDLKSSADRIKEINTDIANNAKETWDNLKKYLESDVIVDIQKRLSEQPNSISSVEANKVWDGMREKIELTSQASNTFISKLMAIDDVNERISRGFDYLGEIERVAGVLKTLSDNAIKVSSTRLWGIGGEGLKDDLNDYIKAMEEYRDLSERLRQGSKGESYFIAQRNALEEFRGEVDKTIESIFGVSSKNNFNINEQREFFERVISDTAQKEQMSVKETRIYRMRAEEEYYNYAKNSLTELAKYQQGEQRAATLARLNELEEEFGQQRDLQQTFFEWVNERQASEVRKRFANMTKEEIAHIDWSQPKWKQWAERLARDFSYEYGTSFNDLQKLVLRANTWSIHIPVFFNSIGQSLTQVEEDYEARTGKRMKDNPIIKDAKNQVEIIDALKKKQKEVAQELETAQKAGGKYYEENKKRLEDENKALTDDIHAYNALTEAEEKAQKKSERSGTKKDILGETISKEVQLISDAQKRLKEYRDVGVTTFEAVSYVSNEYSKSLNRLNVELGKYGLKGLMPEQIAKMDKRDVVDYYQGLLDSVGASTKAIETLDKAIANLNVDITKENYKRITDGLNNELGKLKDEYELAVELDANPELGEIFANMFDLDTSNFPHTIDDYMKRVQGAFDDAIVELGYGKGLDVFKASADDWEKWGENVGLAEEALDKFKSKFVDAQGVAKKWAQDTVNQIQTLRYELIDTNDKLAIEQEKLSTLQEKLTQTTNKNQIKLLNLQIEKQKMVIAKLGEEVLQMLPTYRRLFSGIVEHSAWATRQIAEQWEKALESATKNNDETYTITDPLSGEKSTITKKQYGKELERVNGELRKVQTTFEKFNEAFTKGEDGMVDWVQGLSLIASEAEKAAQGLREISSLWESFGYARGDVETLNDISTTLESLSSVGKGVGQLMAGDIAGGAVSVISGLGKAIKSWMDNANNRINDSIENSQYRVKKLELAYKDLERAVDDAYGTAVAGAQRATIENKKLQLAELERQLALEKSRDSKHKDDDAIMSLEGSIKDLMKEIDDSTNSIVANLLDVSSVADAVENMVTSVMDALRKGESGIDAWNDSIDEMMYNLVKKFAMTHVIAPMVESAFDKMDAIINKDSDDEWETVRQLQQRNAQLQGVPHLKKQLEENERALEEAKARAEQASEVTAQDIDAVNLILEGLKMQGGSAVAALQPLFDRWGITAGEGETTLSALQQGIQGITEDTASALEAYMNNVWQNVAVHTDLLTQIRDFMATYSFDVQLGISGQMLLQLQQSYQLQSTIATMLTNWSSPNGMAVRVEMA